MDKCKKCNEQCEVGFINCERCRLIQRQIQKEYRLRLKHKGLCIKCGKNKIKSPHVKCDICIKIQSEWQRKKSNKNLKMDRCADCSMPKAGVRFCEDCCLKRTASKRLGNVSHWKELKIIYDRQKGICPYTGSELILGRNAALDHITPLSTGGTNANGNLQWVSRKANEMKWHYSENEFLNLVKQIYEYRVLQNVK